jgi:hypothetical protein
MTTEVIGDGEVGAGPRLKIRDNVARSTSEGEMTLMIKTARDSPGTMWPAIAVVAVLVNVQNKEGNLFAPKVPTASSFLSFQGDIDVISRLAIILHSSLVNRFDLSVRTIKRRVNCCDVLPFNDSLPSSTL